MPISPICVSGENVTCCRQAVLPPFRGAGVIPNSGGGTGVAATTTRSLVAHGSQSAAATMANTQPHTSGARLGIEPHQRHPEAAQLQQHSRTKHKRVEHDASAAWQG